MIGHNWRTECARESVKTFSDSKDFNAFLRYVARTCHFRFAIVTFFGEKLGFHVVKNSWFLLQKYVFLAVGTNSGFFLLGIAKKFSKEGQK